MNKQSAKRLTVDNCNTVRLWYARCHYTTNIFLIMRDSQERKQKKHDL